MQRYTPFAFLCGFWYGEREFWIVLLPPAEEWPWSSVRDYRGSVRRPIAVPGGLAVDQVFLPADRRTLV